MMSSCAWRCDNSYCYIHFVVISLCYILTSILVLTTSPLLLDGIFSNLHGLLPMMSSCAWRWDNSYCYIHFGVISLCYILTSIPFLTTPPFLLDGIFLNLHGWLPMMSSCAWRWDNSYCFVNFGVISLWYFNSNFCPSNSFFIFWMDFLTFKDRKLCHFMMLVCFIYVVYIYVIRTLRAYNAPPSGALVLV